MPRPKGNGPGAGNWASSPARNGGSNSRAGIPGPGRPAGVKDGQGKKARAADLARDHVADAVEVWRAVMMDATQPAQARIAAAEKIVDRAEGKPVQPSDITSGGERIGYVIQAPVEAEDADEWARQHSPH